MKFLTPDLTDNRIRYAAARLEEDGFIRVEKRENADFILLGVNTDKGLLTNGLPVFAGNVRADNVFDYTKHESFALENAYITAESAVALAVCESERSLINASVLITGYGRIAKALQRYLSPLTRAITVCARSNHALTEAACKGAKAVPLSELRTQLEQDFIFNTVPHPLFNAEELSQLREGALLIDLASFPGGVDKHAARVNEIRLIEARGLPAKYSPKSAGAAVACAVEEMIKEVFV